MEQRRGCRRHSNRFLDYNSNREEYIRCLEIKLRREEKRREEWERKAYRSNFTLKVVLVLASIFLIFSLLTQFSLANVSDGSNDVNCKCSTEDARGNTVDEPEKTNVIDTNTSKEDFQDSISNVMLLTTKTSSEEYYYNISYEEKLCIAKVVYAEARGEIFEGKVAVANCILNRYYYGEGMGFDRESIYSVVTQENQFASISNVTSDDLTQNPECMEAVEAACKGWDPTREVFENGAFFFFNPDKLSAKAAADRENIVTMRIENHLFHENFEKVN